METELITPVISLALSIIALGYSIATYLWSKKRFKTLKEEK